VTPYALLPIMGIVLAIAGLTSGFATPLVRRLARHVGMMDEGGERRMHEQPKPRIGGIAVFLGFAFALFSVLGYLIARNQLRDFEKIHDVIGMLFGATLILMVGIWDDIMGMRPRNKFVAQIVVAGISLLYGFVIKDVENPFHRGDYIHFSVPWNYAISLVWYLGMMNAINFIDGLDGLLSGLTAICGASLAIIAVGHGHPELALVLAALVGGALGFLPYNYNPATIILGDSGALFIGYVFATVSIVGTSKTAFTISLLIPLVVLALPILDTAATIVRRTSAGKNITEADRGHFHHQLVFRFGLNVRQAVLLIYALCAVLGVVAFLLSGGIGSLRLAQQSAAVMAGAPP
jgi:UDP-GlcNAc:undecaprenyl-phosphate/decaprenyl-phosphate GlcNAc-1-phosphate transferase